MIIRSQDKKIIKPIESCGEIYVLDSMVFIDGRGFGAYSTEEKAIKVLDDICSFANGFHFEKIATDQCGRLDGVVFQMPQDSEV